VSNGEHINLTCTINTDEIDWYFKDSNSTTNIISNGLRLQFVQHIHSALPHKLTKNNNRFLKYQVSSDHNFKHILTVYVEGKKDEGIYQCIDSKSEVPVKRTIQMFLSKLNRIFLDLYFLTKKSAVLT
jgi:hypothetical protein